VAREKLSRSEQRFNYAIAVAAVLVVAALIVFSPEVSLGGGRVPVLPLALLAGAFLFGLGQMAVGLSRRRRWLRSLKSGGLGTTAPESQPDKE
jgi:hypothetical protein